MVGRVVTAHFSKACNFPGAAGLADTPLPSCQSPVPIAPLPAFSSSVPITFLPLCFLRGPFQFLGFLTCSQIQLVNSFHDCVNLPVTSALRRFSIPSCMSLAPFPIPLQLFSHTHQGRQQGNSGPAVWVQKKPPASLTKWEAIQGTALPVHCPWCPRKCPFPTGTREAPEAGVLGKGCTLTSVCLFS